MSITQKKQSEEPSRQGTPAVPSAQARDGRALVGSGDRRANQEPAELCHQPKSIDVARTGPLERWREQVRKYIHLRDHAEQHRVLSEHITMAALELRAPDDLEAYLQMNSSRFSTYSEIRNDVMAYAESRTGARFGGGEA